MAETKVQTSLSELFGSIEAAANQMKAMDDRIVDLEASNYRLDEENNQLEHRLQEVLASAKVAGERLESAVRGAEAAEVHAVQRRERMDHLVTELNLVNGDIVEIMRAVTDLQTRGDIRRS